MLPADGAVHTSHHVAGQDLIGSYEWKGNLDLLNIIMLGLAKNLPEHDETYELHRLLGALLSKELTIDEKLNIIGNEYDIPIEENFRKDVSVMCNLSQGMLYTSATGAARKAVATLFESAGSIRAPLNWKPTLKLSVTL